MGEGGGVRRAVLLVVSFCRAANEKWRLPDVRLCFPVSIAELHIEDMVGVSSVGGTVYKMKQAQWAARNVDRVEFHVRSRSAYDG